MDSVSKGEQAENGQNGSSGDEPGSLATALSGCAYLIFVLLVTTCMLITNAIVCLSIHSAVMSLGPRWLAKDKTLAPHIGQLFFFLAPVLLTIIQWNLLDRLDRLFRRPS
jgi:hypothetical protein